MSECNGQHQVHLDRGCLELLPASVLGCHLVAVLQCLRELLRDVRSRKSSLDEKPELQLSRCFFIEKRIKKDLGSVTLRGGFANNTMGKVGLSRNHR